MRIAAPSRARRLVARRRSTSKCGVSATCSCKNNYSQPRTRACMKISIASTRTRHTAQCGAPMRRRAAQRASRRRASNLAHAQSGAVRCARRWSGERAMRKQRTRAARISRGGGGYVFLRNFSKFFSKFSLRAEITCAWTHLVRPPSEPSIPVENNCK